YLDVGKQLIFFQLLVSCDLHGGHFMSRSTRHLINDGFAVWLLLHINVDFRIKEAFALEMGDKVLPSFLDQLSINAYLLIDGQQLPFSEPPDMRARDFHMDQRPSLDVKMDVRAISL